MTNNRGFIKLILLIIVVVLVLSYFGVNLKKIAESDTSKANFAFIWDMVSKGWAWLVHIWDKYLVTSAQWLWNEVILKYIWPPLARNLDRFIKK